MNNLILSEEYRKRIQELSGLIIEGNADKLKKLGFNDAVANQISDIDDKLAIFFANIITMEFIKNKNIGKENLKEILPLINQNELSNFINDNTNVIDTILVWIKQSETPINLKEIKTLREALDMSIQWHNSLQATGVINDESGHVVKTYPDRFYWIDLNTNSSGEEGRAMGHCGTDSRATTLFSLRDKNKEPHVTIAYNEDSNTVTQVKGKQNRKPEPKYMTYVFDFLKSLSANNKLDNFSWSYQITNGGDLNGDEIKNIIGPKKYFYMLKNNVNKNISNIHNRA